jgi:hypothetical protein
MTDDIAKIAAPMQHDKIVEAMARGMQAECPDYFDLTWDKTPPRAQARYERYAEAALTALEALGMAVVPGWQDIASAPRDGAWVQLTGGSIDYGWDEPDDIPRSVSGQWVNSNTGGRWQFAWYDSGYFGEYENPAHWMPLPAAPNQRGV